MPQADHTNFPEVLVVGEVLFDIFTDYRRMGGAPFNFAVHMHKMGFNTRFISRIGQDESGREIIDFMTRTGLDPRHLQTDASLSTGRVMVNLDGKGVPAFDILKNVAYDNLDYTDDIDHLLSLPLKLIYFGTLLQRTRRGFETVQRILSNRHSETEIFCDLNLRPGCYSREILLACLKQTDMLKLNHEELLEIGELIDSQKDVGAIADLLMKNYAIEIIAVTHGAQGSQLFTPNFHKQTKSPKIGAMQDTVGAGDAFAAAVAAGHLMHWPVDRTLEAASRFAAKICGVKGALPTDNRFYEEFNNNIS